MSDAPKPQIVFLHGLLSSPLDFGEQVKALPDTLTASAPWLRGTRPGSSDETFTIGDAAADLGMSIELSGAPSTTIFAVEQGALVALDLALARPDLELDLVLVGNAIALAAGAKAQRRVMALMPAGLFSRRGIDKERALAGLDALTEVDLWGRLAELNSRVLLIVGERDRPGRTAATRMAEAAPHVQTEIVPRAGGSPHTDRPAAVTALLYEFVGHPPRG